MRPIPIQLLDKDDLRDLPPVPEELMAGMKELVDTRINAPGFTLFEKLEAVYAYLDRYNAFVATFTVCEKGCNHCCRVDVNVSRLEAEYIAVTKGAVLDGGETRTGGHEGACPFLASDGACSVYSARPFNCRTLHTLDDPKYCASGDVPHQLYGASGFGYQVPVYTALAAWLQRGHDQRGAPYRDIRDWFPGGTLPKPSLLQRLFRRKAAPPALLRG